jgi:hypothetical protein
MIEPFLIDGDAVFHDDLAWLALHVRNVRAPQCAGAP